MSTSLILSMLSLGALSIEPRAVEPRAVGSKAVGSKAVEPHDLLERAGHELLAANFSAADALLARASEVSPGHPSVLFHVATSCWWQAIAHAPDSSGAVCLDEVNQAIDSIKRSARQNARDPRAHYYLGRAYGLRARIRGVDGHITKAIGDMRRTHRELERAEDLDPSIRSESVDMGLYKYLVSSLPAIGKVVRWLLFLPGGDRAEGLERLEEVAAGTGLASHEATIYLAGIDIRYERRPHRGAARLASLRDRFPSNPYSHLHLARALRRSLRQPREALAIYDDLRAMPIRWPAARRWAQMGEGMTLLQLGELSAAQELLKGVAAVRDSSGDEALRGLVRIAVLRGDLAAGKQHFKVLDDRDRKIAKRYARYAGKDLKKPPGKHEQRFAAARQDAVRAHRAGKRAAARASFETSLSLRPGDPLTLDGLARLAFEEGRYHEAHNYGEWLTDDKASAEIVGNNHYRLAQIQELAADPVEALRRYGAIEALPGLPRLKQRARCRAADLIRPGAPNPVAIAVSPVNEPHRRAQ